MSDYPPTEPLPPPDGPRGPDGRRPDDDRRGSSPWAMAFAVLVALLVGAGIALLVKGNDNGKTHTVTRSVTTGAAKTQNKTNVTVTAPTRTVTVPVTAPTVTVTVPTSTSGG